MRYRKPIHGTIAEEANRFAHDKEQEIILEFRRNVIALKPGLSEREVDAMVQQAMRETNN